MGKPSLRLLVALTTGAPGGAELALATFLRHLPEDFDARALLLAPGPIAGELERLGVPVDVARLAGRPTPRRAAGFARTLARSLREQPPDVILASGIKAALLVLPAARAAGVPLVWHKVDFAYDGTLARPLSLACSGVVAVSKAVAAGVAPSRLLGVVPPPVRLAEEFRVSPERPTATLGSLGRLTPYKGHHLVLEAAERLAPEFPALEVVIAGGPAPEAPGYAERLREQARRSGLGGRVHIEGHVEQVEHVLERLSVFVLATYRDEKGFGHEGLSAAMLEASWAGLPVVASSGGGTAEGLRDRTTGLLVTPGDAAALAEACGSYLRDPAAARAAGQAGAAFAREHFRPAALAEKLFDHVRAVARRGPGGA